MAMPATMRADAVAMAVIGSVFSAVCCVVWACWVTFSAIAMAWVASVSASWGLFIWSCFAWLVRFRAVFSWFIS